MPRSSGQDGDIPSLERQDSAASPAELHLSVAASDPQHLVDAGMIMHITVNPVAPRAAPQPDAVWRVSTIQSASRPVS